MPERIKGNDKKDKKRGVMCKEGIMNDMSIKEIESKKQEKIKHVASKRIREKG